MEARLDPSPHQHAMRRAAAVPFPSKQRPGRLVLVGLLAVSTSREEMIFYDNGCVVNATSVTTGRPQLPTPTGTFSIFLKEGPVEIISGYPPSSPSYYTPVMIQYVMEFLSGGYFIHNAHWEATDDYGPGSQYDNVIASHGCLHTPLATMAWAYSWTPIGTPVVITA